VPRVGRVSSGDITYKPIEAVAAYKFQPSELLFKVRQPASLMYLAGCVMRVFSFGILQPLVLQ